MIFKPYKFLIVIYVFFISASCKNTNNSKEQENANHLIHETSAYLLEHAHNPVDWYPWGDEAINKAKNESKLLIISVGYSSCHWCHVMERESFSDTAVSRLMNKYFVSIKVDREERPDIDNVYMTACQISNRNGACGWPLNAIALPDGKPIWVGSYLSKDDWMKLLNQVNDLYHEDQNELQKMAYQIANHLQTDHKFTLTSDKISFDEKTLQSLHKKLSMDLDYTLGGRSGDLKFPMPTLIQYAMEFSNYSKDAKTEGWVKTTLNEMMNGGIFDQIDGGFARYTVDKKWIIPHFEKMLYDNALLIHLYAEVYMSTLNKDYLQVVLRSLDFLEREMMNDEFGFYSSYDADSEGVEGKYYTFTYSEIEKLFTKDIAFICRLYNIEKTGNWEHTNILYRTVDNATLATEFSLEIKDVENKISFINKKLLKYRTSRIKPGLDDKIILSWNALTCSAFVQSYKATAIEKFKYLAIKNMEFLSSAFEDKFFSGQLFHTYKNGNAKHPAFIEDYAAMIQALLDVYEITSEEKYLQRAHLHTTFVIENFMDTDGMFYFTHKDQKDIPLRNKDFYDNATPSGNSMMVHDLIRLSIFTGEKNWYDIAINMLLKLKPSMLKHGSSFGNWLGAALKITYPYGEVAVIGNDALSIMGQLQHIYYPHLIFQTDISGNSEHPLLKNRFKAESTYIHLCKNNVCKLPVSSVPDYLLALKEF